MSMMLWLSTFGEILTGLALSGLLVVELAKYRRHAIERLEEKLDKLRPH